MACVDAPQNLFSRHFRLSSSCSTTQLVGDCADLDLSGCLSMETFFSVGQGDTLDIEFTPEISELCVAHSLSLDALKTSRGAGSCDSLNSLPNMNQTGKNDAQPAHSTSRTAGSRSLPQPAGQPLQSIGATNDIMFSDLFMASSAVMPAQPFPTHQSLMRLQRTQPLWGPGSMPTMGVVRTNTLSDFPPFLQQNAASAMQLSFGANAASRRHSEPSRFDQAQAEAQLAAFAPNSLSFDLDTALHQYGLPAQQLHMQQRANTLQSQTQFTTSSLDQALASLLATSHDKPMGATPEKAARKVLSFHAVRARKPSKSQLSSQTADNRSPQQRAASPSLIIMGDDERSSAAGSNLSSFTDLASMTSPGLERHKHEVLASPRDDASTYKPATSPVGGNTTTPSFLLHPNASYSTDLKCAHCQTEHTSVWRRTSAGELVCNACGLYFKIHCTIRPQEVSTRRAAVKTRRRRRPSGGHL